MQKRRFYLADGKTRSARITFRTTPEIRLNAEKMAEKKGQPLASILEDFIIKQIDKTL